MRVVGNVLSVEAVLPVDRLQRLVGEATRLLKGAASCVDRKNSSALRVKASFVSFTLLFFARAAFVLQHRSRVKQREVGGGFDSINILDGRAQLAACRGSLSRRRPR